MSIQMYTSFPFTAPQGLAYGATGSYVGELRFDLFNQEVSAISAVNITSMNVLFSGSNPAVTFTLSGFTLPFKLLRSGTELSSTSSVYYTVNVNNNYLHASTVFAHISSYVTSVAEIQASTVAGTYTNQTHTSMGDGYVSALGDAGAPSNVEWFRQTTGDRTVTLTWSSTALSDVDISSIKVRRLVDSPIRTVADGTLVYTGLSAQALSGFTDNFTVSYIKNAVYAIYTTDNVGKTSTLLTVSAVPTFEGIWSTIAEHSRLYVQDEF